MEGPLPKKRRLVPPGGNKSALERKDTDSPFIFQQVTWPILPQSKWYWELSQCRAHFHPSLLMMQLYGASSPLKAPLCKRDDDENFACYLRKATASDHSGVGGLVWIGALIWGKSGHLRIENLALSCCHAQKLAVHHLCLWVISAWKLGPSVWGQSLGGGREKGKPGVIWSLCRKDTHGSFCFPQGISLQGPPRRLKLEASFANLPLFGFSPLPTITTPESLITKADVYSHMGDFFVYSGYCITSH